MNEQPKKKLYKRWWFLMLVAIVLYLLIFRLFFPFALIAGSSMDPTVRSGNIVFAERFFRPERGDIVIVSLNQSQSTIKRIVVSRMVGLPGELIEIKDGSVFVSGQLLDEPYAYGTTTVNVGLASSKGDSSSVTLGSDEFYVLGDNRTNSFDSRTFGPVSRSSITSKVLFK